MKRSAYPIGMALLSLLLVFAVRPARRAAAAATDGTSYVTYAYLPHAAPLYDESGAVVCMLPATYFVLPGGSKQNGKLPVSYADISGYMLVSDIEIVDYEPVTKFAKLKAYPYNDGLSVNLRARPDPAEGAVLATVPASATLTLYGGREGSELFAGAGTLWQYVRYDGAQGAVFGYIYAPQLRCDAVTPNTLEKVPRPDPPQNDVTLSPDTLSLSRAGNIALIAALCVPAGALMLVLFYRPDSKRTPRHANASRNKPT